MSSLNDVGIMALEIALVQRSDFPDIARIDEAAMKDNGVTQAIGIACRAQNISRSDIFLKHITGSFDRDKHTFFKVVDTSTGEMIAVAKYSFHCKAEEEPQESAAQAEIIEPSRATGTGDEVKEVEDEAKAAAPMPNIGELMRVMKALFQDWADFSKEYLQGKPHASRP